MFCTQKFHFKKKKLLDRILFSKKARIHPYVKVTKRNKSTKYPRNYDVEIKPETVLVKHTEEKLKINIPSHLFLKLLHQKEKNNPVYVENHFIFLLLFSDDQPFRIDANFSVKNSKVVVFS